MGLSPKQLKLVFAKLRAKGLLKYVKKSRPSTWTAKAAKPLKKTEGRVTQEFVNRLEGRLPQAHRKLAALKGGVVIYPSRGAMARAEGTVAAGMYDFEAQRLLLSAPPVTTRVPGYTTRPSGALGRYRLLRISSKHKAFYVSHDTMLRQARVSAAVTYYHEYGHAVNHKGRFSKSGDWAQVVAREWIDFEAGEPTTLMAVGRTGGAMELPPLKNKIRTYSSAIKAYLTGKRETRKTLDSQEAWSESYASYALSKTRRNMLRKNRPESYEYMRKFFEEK